MTNVALLAEFFVLYLLLPLAFRFSPVALPPLPLLWVAALYCYLVLRHDNAFTASLLCVPRVWPAALGSILLIFAASAALLSLAVWRVAPDLLFVFPRTRPGLWAAVMVLYPVLSVFPQGIVYRAFLTHRYAPLVARTSLSAPTQTLLLVALSASAFAFMHIVFRNPLAVTLTAIGGALFAWRYNSTGAEPLAWLEHTLYGCLLFTIGLGQYFYHGRIKIQ